MPYGFIDPLLPPVSVLSDLLPVLHTPPVFKGEAIYKVRKGRNRLLNQVPRRPGSLFVQHDPHSESFG
jgi:hypothetical protein